MTYYCKCLLFKFLYKIISRSDIPSDDYESYLLQQGLTLRLLIGILDRHYLVCRLCGSSQRVCLGLFISTGVRLVAGINGIEGIMYGDMGHGGGSDSFESKPEFVNTYNQPLKILRHK